MTKKDAISVICNCAALYNSNLCNKQLAFVYWDNNHKVDFVEVVFQSNNFLHFTGVSFLPKEKASGFYYRALDHRLRESDIKFRNNGTTDLKLKVLRQVMNIAYSARMIGDYMGPQFELYTEKVVGTTVACLGLIKKNDLYVPNTVLNHDIRSLISKPAGRILGIYRKSINQDMYMELTYRSDCFDEIQKDYPSKLSDKLYNGL